MSNITNTDLVSFLKVIDYMRTNNKENVLTIKASNTDKFISINNRQDLTAFVHPLEEYDDEYLNKTIEEFQNFLNWISEDEEKDICLVSNSASVV